MHLLHLPQTDGAADRQWQPVRTDTGVRVPVVSARGAGPQSQPHQGAAGGHSTATEPAGL